MTTKSEWVALGSESALKIRAVEAACKSLKLPVRVRGCAAVSGVGIQPFGYELITLGARNRARDTERLIAGVAYRVGVESGIVQIGSTWFDTIAVVAIETRTDKESVAYSTAFPIPEWLVREVLAQSTEIGAIVQVLVSGGEKDSYAYFSGGRVKREEVIAEAVKAAFAPFLESARFLDQV